MQLYNKLSAQERADLLEAAGTERLTLSFYQYAHIGNPQLFRDHLFLSWEPIEILGIVFIFCFSTIFQIYQVDIKILFKQKCSNLDV